MIKWATDRQCGKEILVLVSEKDSRFYVARGKNIKVTGNKFTEFFDKEVSLCKIVRFTMYITFRNITLKTNYTPKALQMFFNGLWNVITQFLQKKTLKNQ